MCQRVKNPLVPDLIQDWKKVQNDFSETFNTKLCVNPLFSPRFFAG